MMNQTFLYLVIAAISVLSGCSKKEDANEVKHLKIAVKSVIKGFDPIQANDRYTSGEIGRVYEGLLAYHYLKRPYELIPNLAESMPKVSDDGLTYTFKIRKGVKFHDDAAFPNGKGRELVAQDFVYSLKRVADPKNLSVGWWMYQSKIKGLDEWRDKYKGKPKTNYDEEVEGLKALDKYTLQFVLNKKSPVFLYGLAMQFSFVVAREVVEHYGAEFLNHPVGTSAFMLVGKFRQQNRVTYIKNPNFREKYYPTEASEEFKKWGYLKDAGKRLPLVDKITVNFIYEENTRWLQFNNGGIDYIVPPKDHHESVIQTGDNLSPEMKKREDSLRITTSMDVTYIAFNHHHPIFKNNLKLKQAMSMAYDTEKSNRLFYNSTGIIANSIVPPGISGHVEGFKNPYKQYDVEKAKKLLAEAGYPGGKGLPEITFDTSIGTTYRQMGEFFKKSMAQIGIKIKPQHHPFPELQKRIKTKKTMTQGLAWGGDYPDAENFLQLLYGPNRSPGSNGSNFDDPKYNSLFEKALNTVDSKERYKLYEKLNLLAAENVPWIYCLHRRQYAVVHGWLNNYYYADLQWGQEMYLNVDLSQKKKLLDKFF